MDDETDEHTLAHPPAMCFNIFSLQSNGGGMKFQLTNHNEIRLHQTKQKGFNTQHY